MAGLRSGLRRVKRAIRLSPREDADASRCHLRALLAAADALNTSSTVRDALLQVQADVAAADGAA
jgi:hypothetical protein